MGGWAMRDLTTKLIYRPQRLEIEKPIGPDVSVEKLRDQYDRFAKRVNGRLRPQPNITPVRAGRVDAEWVEVAESKASRVILYFHGGGYVLGSMETHRSLVARLCRMSDARALMVGYRRAPEHRFPGALEDAIEAYRWLLHQGLSARNVVLAGDSAGGGLAISTAMAIRDAEAPMPAAVVAFSPWTDLALTGWSVFTRADTDATYSFETLAVFARLYLNGRSPTEPLASPLYGKFRGLPSMLIHCGSNEILRDDSTRISAKAEAAGVDISVEVWEGMPHAFQFLPHLQETRGSLARAGQFILSRTRTDQRF